MQAVFQHPAPQPVHHRQNRTARIHHAARRDLAATDIDQGQTGAALAVEMGQVGGRGMGAGLGQGIGFGSAGVRGVADPARLAPGAP